MIHGLITLKTPPVKQIHHALPQLKSPLWCLTMKTLWPRQLHLHKCRQRFAGFAKDQGHKSLFRVFQKEKSTNLYLAKYFLKPLQL